MARRNKMNARQLEVEKAKLKRERELLNEMKAAYREASRRIAENIKIKQGKIETLLRNFDDLSDEEKSVLQSVIYQKKFQEQLQSQIDGYIEALNSKQHESLDEYFRDCYENGYVGSIYDMHGQGVPVITPLNQKHVAKAAALSPKLSRRLYGTYAQEVKLAVKREISRGIATSSRWADIARNLDAVTNMGFNKMMRIARTEGHRIQCESAFEAQQAARAVGADVVKQWDSTLDGRTRPEHARLDGQLQELDDPFEVNGMEAMYPSDFGIASMDINCRCALLQRARWALDDDELAILKSRAEFFGLANPSNFSDFVSGYNKAQQGGGVPAAGIDMLIPLYKATKHTIGQPRTSGQLKKAAEALNMAIDNYVPRNSKWSGHINVNIAYLRKLNADGTKEWSCDIALMPTSGNATIVHELLHARSVSHYGREAYMNHRLMEEASVEFLAQEICRNEGVAVGAKAYNSTVDILRVINRRCNFGTDLEFAMELFAQPLPDRYMWLENKVMAWLDSQENVTLMDRQQVMEYIGGLYGG